jgi:predicted nucleic acid-binding protein
MTDRKSCMGCLVDTNIFINAWTKGHPLPDARLFTSSVVLQELLGAQRGDAAFHFALPRMNRWVYGPSENYSLAKYWTEHAKARPVSISSDQIILDFSVERPSRVERGHATITAAFNNADRTLLKAYSSVVGKEKSRRILQKFDSLRSLNVFAVPLTDSTAQLGLDLYYSFLESHNSKKFERNTLNDMLILATAFDQSLDLATEDGELARFAQEVLERETSMVGAIHYSWAIRPGTKNAVHRESKFFVNNPWRARRVGERL